MTINHVNNHGSLLITIINNHGYWVNQILMFLNQMKFDLFDVSIKNRKNALPARSSPSGSIGRQKGSVRRYGSNMEGLEKPELSSGSNVGKTINNEDFI